VVWREQLSVQSGTQWIYELRVFYLCNFPSLENFRMGVTSSCSCQSSAAMPSTTIACALSVDILLFFTVRKTSSLEPQVYIESHWRKIFAIHISLVESNWYWRSAWGTLRTLGSTKRRRKYLASSWGTPSLFHCKEWWNAKEREVNSIYSNTHNTVRRINSEAVSIRAGPPCT
jgi:hypothetical protein